jgi:hypothetical protein
MGNASRMRIERDDETVRRTVRALIDRRGLDLDQVATTVGIPIAAFERRLASAGSSYAFTAGEVRSLAEYFGIEGGELFDYMDGAYVPPADWRPRG